MFDGACYGSGEGELGMAGERLAEERLRLTAALVGDGEVGLLALSLEGGAFDLEGAGGALFKGVTHPGFLVLSQAPLGLGGEFVEVARRPKVVEVDLGLALAVVEAGKGLALLDALAGGDESFHDATRDGEAESKIMAGSGDGLDTGIRR